VQFSEPINAYDLGLPVPIAPLEERRRGVPSEVWSRLQCVKEAALALLGPRLREVQLFGSYARNQFDDESDVDVLILVEGLQPDERQRVVDTALALTGRGVVLSPLPGRARVRAKLKPWPVLSLPRLSG
jgi:predicted nucleotidyltransferase